jgi:glycosyltransferase involved in cell wall biosynthesis
VSQPRLSVGFAVYNGEKTLRRAFDTVLAQTYRDYQLIVSDNASTDGTEAICREYAAVDARIVYHRQSTNIGLGPNFEFVLRQSTAPFFVRIAHDDYFESADYLEKLMKAAEAGHDLVFPAIRKFVTAADGSVVQWTRRGGDAPLPEDRFAAHLALMRRHYLGYQIACGVVRREVLDSVSVWLRSNYFDRVPDEEPYLHFVLSRYRWKYVPEVCFAKDMTQSFYLRHGLFSTIGPLFWQTLAVAGIVAQADYTAGQKLALMLVKAARSCFVALDLAVKNVRRPRLQA